MRQKMAVFLLVAVLVMSLPGWASAAAQPSTDKSVYVNGKKISYAQAPIVQDGTTLVSARETIEALGLTFIWDSGNKRIIGTNGEMTLAITVGKLTAAANGITVVLGTPAVEKNGRNMVPLKFLTESLGASMTVQDNRISITKGAPEKSAYYTGLPLQITNTAVTNLSDQAVKVNYVEYRVVDGEFVPVEQSLTLEAGKKGAFAHSSATIPDEINEDNVSFNYWGRVVKSIETDGTVAMAENFEEMDAMYQSDAFIVTLSKTFGNERKRQLAANHDIPLRIEESYVTRPNVYPLATIAFTNLADKRIVYFELSFSCYDASGNPVKHILANTNRAYAKAASISMEAGSSKIFTWELVDYYATDSIQNIKMDKVVFSDGTSWVDQ